MTLCVAWRSVDGGVTLAADRRMITPDHGIVESEKIFKLQDVDVAFAGDVVVEQVLRYSQFDPIGDLSVPAWWFAHVKPTIDRLCPDNEFDVIVYRGGTIYVTVDGFLREVTVPFVAIGSASAFAYGYYAATEYVLETTQLVSGGGQLFLLASLFDEKVGDEFSVVNLKPAKTTKTRKRSR